MIEIDNKKYEKSIRIYEVIGGITGDVPIYKQGEYIVEDESHDFESDKHYIYNLIKYDIGYAWEKVDPEDEGEFPIEEFFEEFDIVEKQISFTSEKISKLQDEQRNLEIFMHNKEQERKWMREDSDVGYVHECSSCFEIRHCSTWETGRCDCSGDCSKCVRESNIFWKQEGEYSYE